ncbi:poly-gamma-glutamate hydrolase family protein [Polyangium mundeleinium]|uniref:Lipoprotein n=1 Tax=Polyangium mundeleinium TaxID=2995306 RepID=A0ABT5EUF7_9BACT|nr:hypothetical protein [Polyangium mundeleinium]MDC0745074.1 hypothetical protein [Polyangium mundeleinium]
MKNASMIVPVLACALAACGGEQAGDGIESIGVNQAALNQSSITVTVDSSMTSKERCRVPSSMFDSMHANSYVAPGETYDTTKFHYGEQLLIKRGTTLRGLCTVDGVASSTSDIQVSQTLFTNRVALAGETTSATGVTVSNEYASGVAPAIAEPATTISAVKNSSSNKVREFLSRDANTKVVYTAPHPFEDYTFDQVEGIYNHNPTRNGAWVVGINSNDPSADAKFHITSTDISWRSFPLLQSFVPNQVYYSVSFHRHACSGVDIQVGGSIFPEFRQGVAEILSEYLQGEGLDIAWSNTSGCDLAGSNQFNYVNWIGSYGGVQIEQSPAVLDSTTRREKARDAVRSVYDCLLDPADDSDVHDYADQTNGQQTVVYATNGDYATDGECPRFIGDIEVPSTPLNRPKEVITAVWDCEVGDTAHVDIYGIDGYGHAFRVGGGMMEYVLTSDMNCDSVKVTTGPTPWIEPEIYDGATYRAVIRASSSTGQPKGAVFAIQW